MSAFVILLWPSKPLTKEGYPSLFEFLSSIKAEMLTDSHTSFSVLAFPAHQSAEDVRASIEKHVHDEDEVVSFSVKQVSCRANPKRFAALREFVSASSSQW